MNRFAKTLLILGTALLFGIVAFVAWQFTRPNVVQSRISRTDPRLQPATYRLVRSLEEQTQRDDVPAAFTRLGYAYLQSARENAAGDYVAQAERAFRRALDLDARSFEAMSGLGMVYMARHQFDRALRWGLRSHGVNPHRAATYGILVDANNELGRYDRAAERAQEMVDRRPDLTSYSRVSYVRELHGDLPGAIEAMRRAVSAASASLENTNWCRVYLGHLYLQQGDLDAAEAAYRLALAQLPGYGHALAGMARLALARDDAGEAVDRYEAAVEGFPIPEYVIGLGRAYEAAGRPEAAREQYDTALDILERERASGMDIDEETALLLLNHGDELVRALELARGAYERRPTVKNASILAWAEYKNGRVAEAARHARASLRLHTPTAAFYYRAGVIDEAMDDTARAKQHLERALALNPYFPERDDARERLAALRHTSRVH